MKPVKARIALPGLVIACATALSGQVLSRDTEQASEFRTPVGFGIALAVVPTLATPRTIPPLGAPLIASEAALDLSAKDGNSAAASRLFRETRQCLSSQYINKRLVRLMKDKGWQSNGGAILGWLNGEATREDAKALESAESMQRKLDSTSQLCEGIGSELDDGRVYRSALQAAKLGDDVATACYMTGQFNVPASLMTNVYGQAYRANALQLADAGVARGSWPVVRALVSVYSGTPYGGLTNYLFKDDPSLELRYTLLLRLGTSDDDASAKPLDQRITFLNSRLGADIAREEGMHSIAIYKKSFIAQGPADANSPACPE
jgi:hypothetical protein